MINISDYQLQKEDAVGPPPRESRIGWILGALFIIVAVAVGWFVMRDRAVVQPQQTPAPARSAESESPAASIPDTPLPPLDQTDMLVRMLAEGLSSHPLFAAWLAPDGIIRRFVVVVDNIAFGTPVRKQLTQVTPAGTFRVTGGGQPHSDPRNYTRYSAITGAMESLDPTRASQMYGMLRPRIEEAYKELGRNVSFDTALERAILNLLHAPPIRGDEALVRKEAMFLYANPQLERLSPAQKHLLRMGPDNASRVQSRLRDLALALGIPRDQLP